MLLSITTRRSAATDLGYLLHKNPSRVQSFDLSFGTARVFYPQADDDCCTACMLVEVDPVALVRKKHGGGGFALEQYVNDRPYAASSLLSVAIAQVYGSALAGTSRERPELAGTPIPLEARLSVLPSRGGEAFLRSLFEPLGYEVDATPLPLDDSFPDWGQSPYFAVELRSTVKLSDLLSHLYVLIPVLDEDKHYWIDRAEVDKLLRHGEGWLSVHPQREEIVARYLMRRRHLTEQALASLLEADQHGADEAEEQHAVEEEQVEERISLNEQRLSAVMAVLKSCNAARVLDLGCSNGNLLRRLMAEKQFTEIVGLDVSHRALQIASERLRLDRLPEQQRNRLRLLQGSLIYRDKRLAGYDAAAVVEVIEHLDEPRLAAFERVLFEFAQPRTVVITTPNIEYNVRFPNLPAGRLRHRDHRFEWTRTEFKSWTAEVAERFGYAARFLPVGPIDPEVGPPTQMAVLQLATGGNAE